MLREGLVQALHSSNRVIPSFQTQNNLGDYIKIFNKFYTETDVKSNGLKLKSKSIQP